RRGPPFSGAGAVAGSWRAAPVPGPRHRRRRPGLVENHQRSFARDVPRAGCAAPPVAASIDGGVAEADADRNRVVHDIAVVVHQRTTPGVVRDVHGLQTVVRAQELGEATHTDAAERVADDVAAGHDLRPSEAAGDEPGIQEGHPAAEPLDRVVLDERAGEGRLALERPVAHDDAGAHLPGHLLITGHPPMRGRDAVAHDLHVLGAHGADAAVDAAFADRIALDPAARAQLVLDV